MAKGYHQNNLLTFMQKTMQKEVASNKRDETVGHVPYINNNHATYQEVHRNAMHCLITHIQEAVENQKLHFGFPRY